MRAKKGGFIHKTDGDEGMTSSVPTEGSDQVGSLLLLTRSWALTSGALRFLRALWRFLPWGCTEAECRARALSAWRGSVALNSHRFIWEKGTGDAVRAGCPGDRTACHRAALLREGRWATGSVQTASGQGLAAVIRFRR